MGSNTNHLFVSLRFLSFTHRYVNRQRNEWKCPFGGYELQFDTDTCEIKFRSHEIYFAKNIDLAIRLMLKK